MHEEMIFDHRIMGTDWGFICTLPIYAFQRLGIKPADWVKIITSEEICICKAAISRINTSECHTSRRFILKIQNERIHQGKCYVQKIEFSKDVIPIATTIKVAVIKTPTFSEYLFTDLPENVQIETLSRILDGSLVVDTGMLVQTSDILGKWILSIEHIEPKHSAIIDSVYTHIDICNPKSLLRHSQTKFQEDLASLVLRESLKTPMRSFEDLPLKGSYNSGLHIIKEYIYSILRLRSIVDHTIIGNTVEYVKFNIFQLYNKIESCYSDSTVIIIEGRHTAGNKFVEAHLIRISKKYTNNIILCLDDAKEYNLPGFNFIKLKTLGHSGRIELLEMFVRYELMNKFFDLNSLSSKMNGFSVSDILSILALSLTQSRSKHHSFIELSDMMYALNTVNVPFHLRGKILRIKDITFDQIGGLNQIKRRLRCIFEWPSAYKKTFEKLQLSLPHGVLLYGPPGCSKTSLIRAIASICGMNFFFLDSSKLYSMYLGESERILRETFSEASRFAPSVIFIDEIDTIVGKRTYNGLSSKHPSTKNSVQEGIISTLLNEMDGITPLSGVVVVGATNRPENVDTAIMRPGRFDFLINVPLPTANDRLEILKISTRKFTLSKDVNLEDIALNHTCYFSGADVASVCKEAAFTAIQRSFDPLIITSYDFKIAISSVKNN